jgi:hypothetical protein
MEYRDDLPFRVAGGSPGAQVAGEVARGKKRIPCMYAQCCPSGPSGHGINPDYRGLNRYSPTADAGAAAHYYRAGLRLFLASERVEVVA